MGLKFTVNSYRTIDFPIKPDKAACSMDLSIVALDENGNKPAASKAVYFTAHYEEGSDGKPLLKEISSPIPLKFTSESKDALCYIEHDSKIYTLPITRGKYEEMKIEVAKNNNRHANLSREEERASDKVATHVT